MEKITIVVKRLHIMAAWKFKTRKSHSSIHLCKLIKQNELKSKAKLITIELNGLVLGHIGESTPSRNAPTFSQNRDERGN